MFCDLVGSMGLAATLDPEDWRDLVKAYLGEASKVATALGGHVLTRLGNGLMVLFGYPEAQENDAERAVRAALAIQRALAELNARNEGGRAPEVSARVGLDLGLGGRRADGRGVRRGAEHRGARAGVRRAWPDRRHRRTSIARSRASSSPRTGERELQGVVSR